MSTRFASIAAAVGMLFVGGVSDERVQAQAFVNTDFEAVLLGDPATPGAAIPSVLSVPGWTFSHNSPPQLLPHMGNAPQQFLVGPTGYPSVPEVYPLNGHYSLYLEEGLSSDLTTSVGPWVEQTGLVPDGTNSLRFRQRHRPFVPGQHPWIVSLDGVPLVTTLLPLGPANGNALGLSADSSAFAGGVHTLRIGIAPEFNASVTSFASAGMLDDIHFSPRDYSLIPEPAGCQIAAAAFAAASALRRSHPSIVRRSALAL